MVRRLIIAIATASALGISFYPTDASARRTRAAVADSVPSWDLTASCLAAGLAGYSQTPDERVKSCLASEQRTREELTKHWSTYPAEDRIGCLKSLTFSPTYKPSVVGLRLRNVRSALWVQKRTFPSAIAMSALPPRADIQECGWIVR